MIRKYLLESIDLARQGVGIKPLKNASLTVPAELETALARNRRAAAAFKLLTPGRQREYAGYVDQAKRSETKDRRLAKILSMIVKGIGLNDGYR